MKTLPIHLVNGHWKVKKTKDKRFGVVREITAPYNGTIIKVQALMHSKRIAALITKIPQMVLVLEHAETVLPEKSRVKQNISELLNDIKRSTI